ncbi:Chaperone protein dnaj [Thalictrum thalictroides]|uniref:Chaperone protein dnaj n=1 Tax=Thalictrum thalictroides TaxID=46969 RepID=A0A7J6VNK9_THATH|nr:Chaperone protein dnaj [Thalictrum thalictroides]
MGKKKSKSRVRVSSSEEDLSEEGEVHHNQEDSSDEEEQEQEEPSKKERSLYEILGVERTASQQEIKKAYHKLALRLHPDKNPGDEEAKEKFQQLQKVVSILGDEEKRALYDQTEADIEEFEANYRGSDSEKSDLKDLYKKCKGNMNRLFCSMICSDPKLDSHRFKDIIQEAIAGGELKETKAYRQWAKQISETKPPTNPLKRRAKNKKSDGDLYAIISQRRDQRKEQFDSMFTNIVAKCGGSKSAKSGPEPTEEEFEAARERLERQRQSKKGRKK